MGFLNRCFGHRVLVAHQEGDFPQQFAQERAREVVEIVRGLDERAGAENDVFAVVGFQVVEIFPGPGGHAVGITNDMNENRQADKEKAIDEAYKELILASGKSNFKNELGNIYDKWVK